MRRILYQTASIAKLIFLRSNSCRLLDQKPRWRISLIWDWSDRALRNLASHAGASGRPIVISLERIRTRNPARSCCQAWSRSRGSKGEGWGWINKHAGRILNTKKLCALLFGAIGFYTRSKAESPVSVTSSLPSRSKWWTVGKGGKMNGWMYGSMHGVDDKKDGQINWGTGETNERFPLMWTRAPRTKRHAKETKRTSSKHDL